MQRVMDALYEVTTIAPMKRGLKAKTHFASDPPTGVTTIAPMKRGLKEKGLSPTATPFWVFVTTIAPMKRGLKDPGNPVGAVCNRAVTTIAPMKRGLKGVFQEGDPPIE